MRGTKSATKIYFALTGEPFHMTHYQAKHILYSFYSHLPGVASTVSNQAKHDRVRWMPSADLVSALAYRVDFRDSAKVIMREVWPTYPLGNPEGSFTVARIAVDKLSEAMELDRAQKRTFLGLVEPILERERKLAEEMWDDRMISTYLRVKKIH